MGDKPNIKLSEETGEETRDALKKYGDAYDLNSQEEAIRYLLPEWVFNPLIPSKIGKLKEMTKKSRHYSLDSSSINNISDLCELQDEAEKDGDAELVSEIEDILHSQSSKEEAE